MLHPDRMSLSASPRLAPSTKLLGFTLVPGYEKLLQLLQLLHLLQRIEVFGVVDRRGDPDRPAPAAAVVAVPYDFGQSVVVAAEQLNDVVRHIWARPVNRPGSNEVIEPTSRWRRASTEGVPPRVAGAVQRLVCEAREQKLEL